MRSFFDAGLSQLESVWILGAGATAASLLVAAIRMGAVSDGFCAHASEGSVAARARRIAWRDGGGAAVGGGGGRDRAPTIIITTVPGGAMDLSFSESIRMSAAFSMLRTIRGRARLHRAGSTLAAL